MKIGIRPPFEPIRKFILNPLRYIISYPKMLKDTLFPTTYTMGTEYTLSDGTLVKTSRLPVYKFGEIPILDKVPILYRKHGGLIPQYKLW